jgi:hypothetical protein
MFIERNGPEGETMLCQPGAQAQTQSQVTFSRAQGPMRSNATTTIHIFEDNRLVR